MTSKAQRFITHAFNEHGDNNQKSIWQSWVAACPEIQSTNTSRQALSSMPPDVKKETQSVLEQMSNAMTQRYEEPGITEDDVSNLDNDLSYIRAIMKSLSQPVTPAP